MSLKKTCITITMDIKLDSKIHIFIATCNDRNIAISKDLLIL